MVESAIIFQPKVFFFRLAKIAHDCENIDPLDFADFLEDICRILQLLNKYTSIACEDIESHAANIRKNHSWHTLNYRINLSLQ